MGNAELDRASRLRSSSSPLFRRRSDQALVRTGGGAATGTAISNIPMRWLDVAAVRTHACSPRVYAVYSRNEHSSAIMRSVLVISSGSTTSTPGCSTLSAAWRPSGCPPSNAGSLPKQCCFSSAFTVAGVVLGGGRNADCATGASTSIQYSRLGGVPESAGRVRYVYRYQWSCPYSPAYH